MKKTQGPSGQTASRQWNEGPAPKSTSQASLRDTGEASNPTIQPNMTRLALPPRVAYALGSAWRWAVVVVSLLVIVVALCWLALVHFILPRINDFRPRLEQEITKALGVPVRLGSVEVLSRGLAPRLELRQVQVFDPQGREALSLAQVGATLSAQSLLALNPRFSQLVVDGVGLDVRRDAKGQIWVAGVPLGAGQGDSQASADWVFSQGEVALLRGRITWTDELRGAPPLALSDVNLVLRNPGQRHLFRLDATPPADWGERFSLRGQLSRRLIDTAPGDLRRWAGTVYADFPRVDVKGLNQYVSLPADVRSGLGAVRAWAAVERGVLRSVTADVLLQDVLVGLGALGATGAGEARAAAQLPPLDLKLAEGRLSYAQQGAETRVTSEKLRFVTGDGLQWPASTAQAQWTANAAGVITGGRLKAERLELAPLTALAERLPLPAQMRRLLAKVDPAGSVRALEARWSAEVRPGGDTLLKDYALKGQARDLRFAGQAFDPWPTGQPRVGVPGARALDVDFDLTQAGGQAALRMRQGELELPGFWAQPTAFDSLDADLRWRIDGPLDKAAIKLDIRSLKAVNADTQAELSGSWQTGAGRADEMGVGHRLPGVIDLTGSIVKGQAGALHRYLPVAVPQATRDYIKDSVLAGDLRNGRFRIRFDLWAGLPQTDAQGDFRFSADVSNGKLAYIPQRLVIQPTSVPPPMALPLRWPQMEQVSAEVVWDKLSLTVKNAQGRFAGLPSVQLSKGAASLPNVWYTPTLSLTGDLKATAVDALRLVNTSPLGVWTGGALARAVAGGPFEAKGKLVVPLLDTARTTVQLNAQLGDAGGTLGLGPASGVDFQLSPDTPALTRLRGPLELTERGFSLRQATARVYGGDSRLDVNGRVDANGQFGVQLRAQGTVQAEGLRQGRELGPLSRLATYANGQTAYTAQMQMRRTGVPELSVSTNLVGMALALPAPFNKAADMALPVRYENVLTRDSLVPGARVVDTLTVDVGRVASAQFGRELLPDGRVRVLRGAIGSGGPDALPGGENNVVVASLNLPSINLDQWELVLDRLTEPAAPAPGAATAAAQAASGGAADNPYMPNVVVLRARDLVAEGYTLNNVVVGASREGPIWRANVDATQLAGYAEFRSGRVGPGRVYARLGRLSLAPAAEAQVENLLTDAPTQVPALDIVVEDLELRGRKLGKLEVDAVNRTRDGVREWRLNKLALTVPEASFAASGNWVAVNAQSAAAGPRVPRAPAAATTRRAALNFKLDIADSGALLKRFGYADLVRGGKGKVEGQVGWLGTPFSIDYPSLTGQVNVGIDSGQFLKADPGIAKLLGVLSLQSLPRRIGLDFRDVFSEGFAFDNITGDVKVEQGVASTNNLRMRGVQAAVLMEGSADLARETQNLRVVIVPEINAGTASLAYAVINPVVGLGTFLAQAILRQPLIRAFTYEYRITGQWADPKIERVDRTPPSPGPIPGQPAAN
jgi:uncharacterized protein (TIGR02099 family)